MTFNSTPQIFSLDSTSEREKLSQLFKSNPDINKINTLKNQISELIKIRNPQITNKEKRSGLEKEFIQNIDAEHYGVWVYYSWNNNIVRLLPEKEFIELRTNRNNLKITIEEQNQLQKKTIGIIGLSVGQSVALTLAMERSISELRIADYDTLELSNLNRIRSGIHNINLPKTVIVAREIAEIDPYIKVLCFNEGITKTNLKDFLTKGKKIDLLIDECDSIDIKLQCRIKARELRIPVIMDTSDRGMLDIERFDIEPERPILHGYVNENIIVNENNKMDIANQILDFDNLSERMKLSIKEIGKSISTWPQLASDVILGGAVAAIVSRLILLKTDVKSGRYYFDVENHVSPSKRNREEKRI